MRRHHDHSLPAAQGEVRDCRLVRHGSRQAQYVAKRLSPMEDASSVDDGGGLVQLEVGGEEVKVVLASPAERLVACAESIDVLLRHPPSIAQAAQEEV